MKMRLIASIPVGLFLALAGASTLTAQASAPDMVSVPPSIAAKNVPSIPKDRVTDLLPYENIRTASLADWHPTERKMYIRTRFAQSVQLHEVAMPMGARQQLTFYNDPLLGGTARPGNANHVVFAINEAGAENFQLYLLDRTSGRSERFTDGKSRNMGARWSRDGKLLAWVSNSRNGRDFDLYAGDPAKPGSERRIAELKG